MIPPATRGGTSFPPPPSAPSKMEGASGAKRLAHLAQEVDPELRKAAEGMEAMFLDYLMKVMRQTVPKNEMDLESPATEIYRGMLDSEVAQKAARSGHGVGLADQIIAYLQSERYNLTRGNLVLPQGGAHEGRSNE